uniref:Uncharacterized protein n=1 Tax=uncultured bacterium RM44 TaxID=672208 RepID=D3W8M9_9BACT|nr:hypothetical protein [uncultured bacterium RM44]
MSEIRITLTDGQSTTVERVYNLSGPLDTLDEIEEAVDQFKNQFLPAVQKTLLEQAQQ